MQMKVKLRCNFINIGKAEIKTSNIDYSQDYRKRYSYIADRNTSLKSLWKNLEMQCWEFIPQK